MKECHKCPFNGLSSEACISCCASGQDDHTFRYQQYVLDGYEAPQPQQELPEYATSLEPDVEDTFRKALYQLFDLSYAEICLMKAIMNGKSLSEFAKDMEKQAKSNQKFSRFRAFQTRKSALTKLGDNFKIALTTQGQIKQLKSKMI